MHAVFFVARREDALGVTSSHDLPAEPAAEPLRLDDPTPLEAFGACLGAGARLRPMRDATCRSFPVFEVTRAAARRVAELDDEAIDATASHWKRLAAHRVDADPWELAGRLQDLRTALRTRAQGERLFVLLEDRAV
jgi:hypothetical protein